MGVCRRSGQKKDTGHSKGMWAMHEHMSGSLHLSLPEQPGQHVRQASMDQYAEPVYLASLSLALKLYPVANTAHARVLAFAQAIGPELGPDLISLVVTREEINDLLALDDVIDLVIPR